MFLAQCLERQSAAIVKRWLPAQVAKVKSDRCIQNSQKMHCLFEETESVKGEGRGAQAEDCSFLFASLF